jgi:hypothetical protein
VFGLSTVPNASGVFGANNNGGVGVAGNNDNGSGMVATTKSSANQGIFAANNATAPAPSGSVGGNGVFGLSTVPNASGVFGANNNGGVGVAGNSDHGSGMLATTKSSANQGIFAANNATAPAPSGSVGGNGVFGLSTVPNASGVFGANNNGGVGVAGNSDNGSGMVATTKSSANQGIFAANNATAPAPSGSVGGNGVFGLSTVPNASGVFGANNNGGVGVAGHSDNGDGVFGTSKGAGKSGVVGISDAPFDDANGVFGRCGIAGNAIHGVGGTNAGLFDGHVQINGGLDVQGELTVLGGKHFRIDHPCDPANKYLLHCSVEAPEMINVYSGNAETDETGTITVFLPDYFEALNRDFRYQLTVIGQFAQAIVAEEIMNNRFVIKTDKPNVKISWQVSGVRKDVCAEANPPVVEKEKSAAERALYLRRRHFMQPLNSASGSQIVSLLG